ncbi:MAG: hypothetical protein JWM11_6201 [Planctomycetaceae bacterium]|nr:hypothetical protein [Planctomycetaceae bacterium]
MITGDSTGPKDVRLTPTKFKLLPYLIKYAGEVLTHQQILKEIWVQRTLGTFNTSASTPANSGRSWRQNPRGLAFWSLRPESAIASRFGNGTELAIWMPHIQTVNSNDRPMNRVDSVDSASRTATPHLPLSP